MVFDEMTPKSNGGVQEFVVSREFRVVATNEDEAKLILEQQLIDMTEAVIAVKHIAAALQIQSLNARADAAGVGELPPLEKRAAKDYGSN